MSLTHGEKAVLLASGEMTMVLESSDSMEDQLSTPLPLKVTLPLKTTSIIRSIPSGENQLYIPPPLWATFPVKTTSTSRAIPSGS